MLSKYSWVRTRYLIGERGRNFFERPWAGGVVLIGCVVVAMLLANLPATHLIYEHVLHTDLTLFIESPDRVVDLVFPRDMNVEKLVNDGLMVIFFFVVGLEIKREVLAGELSSLRKSALPVLAALGGMIMPAVIYALFNHGTAASNGWGIPTATDIAFAVGILSLMGDRVPISLKVFLMALAVVDDLGAIVVIALFYGGTIKWGFLLLAIAIMGMLYLFNRLGETRISYFLLPAIAVWGLFYYSGIHATLSGVAMAMLVPTRPRYSKPYVLRTIRSLGARLRRDKTTPTFDEESHAALRRLREVSYNSISMSERLEHLLNPYVSFLIMPVFALANAGVHIDSAYLDIFSRTPEAGSVGMGVFFGLLVGKPLGIFTASWLGVKTGLAAKPDGASWKALFAVACLGGIGFTMSIFVDSLAFADVDFVNKGKVAILAGSIAAALFGALLIRLTTTEPETENTPS